MGKVANLSVHRNTAKRRARKTMRSEMLASAKAISERADVAGYVIVGICKGGNACAAWDTGQAIPLWSLPGFVHSVMLTEAQNYTSHGDDDFSPEDDNG